MRLLEEGPAPLERRDAEALIEEARRLRRRRWRMGLAFVVTVAGVVVAIVHGSGGGGGGRPGSAVPAKDQPSVPSPLPDSKRVVSVAFPKHVSFTAIAKSASGVILLGTLGSPFNPPERAPCLIATLDPKTLRFSAFDASRCAARSNSRVNNVNLAATISSVGVVVSTPSGSSDVDVHVTRLDLATGKLVEGPPVMVVKGEWDWAHSGTPAVADGSLWLYGLDTTKGDEILRISSVTGRVENTIPMPKGFWDPILAADEDGLWVGESIDGVGGSTNAPIFHVAIGSNTAAIAHRGGTAAAWLVASGNSLWADVVSRDGDSQVQTIWRFDGPTARPIYSRPGTVLPPANGGGFGYATVGNEMDGLWTISPHPVRGSSYSCASPPEVIYIDPTTGAQRVVATLPKDAQNQEIGSCGYVLGSSQAATFDGSLYVLDDVAVTSGYTWRDGYLKLFRISLDDKRVVGAQATGRSH